TNMNDGKYRRDWTDVSPTNAVQYLSTKWQILRYSDVLLMFAEAENEINNGPTADAYNAINMMNASAYVWPDNKTILITGGLGGIGKLITKNISETSKGCNLILIGRSQLDSEKSEFIKAMENLGTKIHYVQCDINDQVQVSELIKQYPTINGVIHGSGITKDNLISKKNFLEIDQVLAAKVSGLEILDQATASLPLDYFVTLSSIAGTLGNVGQFDYAAANAYMDAYIHNRAQQVKVNQRYGKSLSINWPLWESGGMQLDEATKQSLLKIFKIKPLPTAHGLMALKQMLASEHQQSVVVFGNKKAIAPMFDKAVSAPVNNQPKKTLDVEMDKLGREILQQVRIQAAEHLKLRPNQLDDTADWAVFGFDSILLSSFTNRFNTQFN
ncbi:MAG: SDR family NAD(P)-dependent oxidoreductase, partial [Moraxellaceae bacterium]